MFDRPTARVHWPWENGVIPLAVKVLTVEGDGREDLIRDANSYGVGMGIESCTDM
jgi:hypothetical protein